MTEKSSAENLWHRRYGHLGEDSLRKLASENMVIGPKKDFTKGIALPCEPCLNGKLSKTKFSKSTDKRYPLLGLVHSDVCGKMSSPSLGGSSYFVTFIDDASRYTWIYALKNKDDVFKTFQQWKEMVELSSGHRIKTLRSDNGGEYCSKKFETYLATHGIRHETTIAGTPEQNGVSERMNWTIEETARCMLADGKMPEHFWAEAVSTAVYLRNRSPTSALAGKTPYEEYHGEKPNVCNFRVFWLCSLQPQAQE